MWSERRFPEQLEPTVFAERLDEARREAGDALIDLTLSNPTRVFPEHRRAMCRVWRGAAERAGSRPYRPEPFGLPEARRAVVSYYAERGDAPALERVALSASTSEAYSWLAKLLADPGGEVLVPSPSYPLFEHLMRLECVDVRRYDYRFDGRWHIDIGVLKRQIETSDDPRAVFGVSPNNPTGHLLDGDAFESLLELARAHDLAVVVDEVFVDYGLDEPDPTSVAARFRDRDDLPLVALLSGLSKTAALPGLKLGWIAFWGRNEVATEAGRRLEFLADQYLSASTASQLAATEVLGNLQEFHGSVRERTRSNLSVLRDQLKPLDVCRIYPAEAGWYAVVRLPDFVDSPQCTLRLASEGKVLVQPGFFYDFHRGEHLVVSLLPDPEAFERGAAAVAHILEEVTSP